MRARLVGRMETSRGRTCLEKTVCVVGKPPAPHNFRKPCRNRADASVCQCHVLTPGGAELPDMTTNACCHHLPCIRGLFLWPGGLRTSTTNALAASICCCCGCGVLRGCRWLLAALDMQRPTRGSTSHITHASEKKDAAFSIPCRIHKTMTPRQNAGLVCMFASVVFRPQHTRKSQSTRGVLGKGSEASVTRMGRPRAVSHHVTFLSAHSSSPLSEPSLKELHTRRAPLGLSQHVSSRQNTPKRLLKLHCSLFYQHCHACPVEVLRYDVLLQ